MLPSLDFLITEKTGSTKCSEKNDQTDLRTFKKHLHLLERCTLLIAFKRFKAVNKCDFL